MDLREFLSCPSIQLPITRDTDDFQAFISSRLDEYLGLLDRLETPSSVCEEIQSQRRNVESFCHEAKEVVYAALAGKLADCYAKFDAALAHLAPYLEKQFLSDLPSDHIGFLYRVRRHLESPLTREDLFHIPFDQRYKVANQRYSIPGLPCLYLSGSIFTCWVEMGRPPFHEIQASAFWVDEGQTVKVVNLSNRPRRLLLFLDARNSAPQNVDEILATNVILWPLIALCSIVARHRSCPYKPEYIIPQLLLGWVTQHRDFDAICYFSTHVSPVTAKPLPPCNFVFPAREIRSAGRCPHLRRLFRMTEPYSWELLRAIAVDPLTPGAAVPNYEFEFIDGSSEQYAYTEFGIVETKLNKLAFRIGRLSRTNPAIGEVAP